MSPEKLAAIRDRVKGNRPTVNWDVSDKDRAALLAEVDRLRAENADLRYDLMAARRDRDIAERKAGEAP